VSTWGSPRARGAGKAATRRIEVCCRLSIRPLDPEIARTVLLVGLFTPQNDRTFQRMISEEGTSVTATINADHLSLAITPAVTQMAEHSHKRLAASVYFEIAARYSEKVDGKITQHSNIGQCIQDGVTEKVLAEYPEHPLDWQRICIGFAEVLAGGHIHEDYEDAAGRADG
jgi:hypothetical protein